MLRKVILWLTPDQAQAARFVVRWNFVDRVFKLVQWVVTIGIIGAFAKAHKGTTDGLILLAITIFLSVAFGVALWAAWQAWFVSRFPDIDDGGLLNRLVVGPIVALVSIGIAWSAYRAVQTIVAARM